MPNNYNRVDKLYTAYNHLSSSEVRVGQCVSQGQQIAKIGATGGVTGPHLDYEVYVGGLDRSNAVNPKGFIDFRGKRGSEGQDYLCRHSGLRRSSERRMGSGCL